jgi:protoporphyrinogen oxidase
MAESDPVVVIGAGPAGLTAAYDICRRGGSAVVYEADSVVGGISRTVEMDGWRFDIGGHRFFTKVPEVESLWHEILPDEDFLLRPRMSRIFYDGKYYDYPLKASNAFFNLGPIEAVLCVLSYIRARIAPPKDQSNYEGWLVARFGWRLYRRFFKTYTEKVWGVPVNQMPSDWAAQRVKSLSLSKAIVNAILPRRKQTDITSLIEEFQYPKYGPGMMWEKCTELIRAAGGRVELNQRVIGITIRDGRAVSVTVRATDGSAHDLAASHVISTMPIAQLVDVFDPPVPDAVSRAGHDLHYRDFLTVALVIPEAVAFPDNWIYIHASEVKVGRIQNFGSWSPFMVKEGLTCLGLEYFVFEGDELWCASDDELVARAKSELAWLGLIPDSVAPDAGYVFRMPKAYPYYDKDYREHVRTISDWLESAAPNVHLIGRNGMHKYNNQDHSMFTALLTVDNIYGAHHDIWSVNVEEEYHEQANARPSGGGTGRDAPILPKRTVAN